jgi:hypothetical protein
VSLSVRHPDTIPGLAHDCLRVLRDEYAVIQARMGEFVPAPRPRISSDQDMAAEKAAHRDRVERKEARVVAAIAEYRRVAAPWGVDVG